MRPRSSRRRAPGPAKPLPLVVSALLAVALVPAGARAETSIERAARTGELSLGFHPGIPPYVQEKANGDLEGYAIDVSGLIAEEVARYLGKPVTVVAEGSADAERLFREVHQGSRDLMCGAQFTWEREMFVDFSIPFALSGIRLLTRGGAIDGTPASLAGKRVGVIGGSLGEATIKALDAGARPTPFPNLEAAMAALRAGRVDALAGDSILLKTQAARAGLANATLVPTVPYNRYAVGCMVPENNSTLRNLVNLALARMIQGYVNDVPRYTQMVNRWVGPGSSVGLSSEVIKSYFQAVLLTHEQILVPTAPGERP
ncbi:MAG: extracellular substrate binding-like orphan protein GrrP [Synechococcaceae cyanobacterium]|nr:extracellular substrate binding-like orphan protein GrrP [Synechococcaceae cyanobacterium]